MKKKLESMTDSKLQPGKNQANCLSISIRVRFQKEFLTKDSIRMTLDAPDVDLKVTNQKLQLHNKVAKVATKVVAPWQAFEFGNLRRRNP